MLKRPGKDKRKDGIAENAGGFFDFGHPFNCQSGQKEDRQQKNARQNADCGNQPGVRMLGHHTGHTIIGRPSPVAFTAVHKLGIGRIPVAWVDGFAAVISVPAIFE